MAPSSQPTASEWSPGAAAARPGPQGTPPRLPAGYRWIAVRPGAPPPPRARRRPLGPTPRYTQTPRWGLVEHFDAPDAVQTQERSGPSSAAVRATVVATMTVLGAAAFLHVVRYVLLLINRTVLLNPIVAGVATWLGVAVSVVAVFLVVASLVMLTNWLIARRAAAYGYHEQTDPRGVWQLRAGCLIPFVQLIFAPVFVLELAGVEHRLAVLRRPITIWWIAWVFSTVLSVFSIATSFTSDPQGIADNTVTTIVAYLLALAALLLAFQVLQGFDRAPVARQVKRWVMVPDDGPVGESARPVESEGQNPAA